MLTPSPARVLTPVPFIYTCPRAVFDVLPALPLPQPSPTGSSLPAASLSVSLSLSPTLSLPLITTIRGTHRRPFTTPQRANS